MSERERRQVDELEAALSAIVAGQEVPSEVGEEVRDLAQIAAHLLGLPGEDFRARLKADLVGATLPTEAEAEPEVDGEAPASTVPPGSPSVVPYLVHRARAGAGRLPRARRSAPRSSIGCPPRREAASTPRSASAMRT